MLPERSRPHRQTPTYTAYRASLKGPTPSIHKPDHRNRSPVLFCGESNRFIFAPIRACTVPAQKPLGMLPSDVEWLDNLFPDGTKDDVMSLTDMFATAVNHAGVICT